MGKKSRRERREMIRSMQGLGPALAKASLGKASLTRRRRIDWALVLTLLIVATVILAHAIS